MDDQLDEHLDQIRRDRPLIAALWGPKSPVGRAVMWAFVVASVTHLLLADAWQLEWLPANVIYVAGLALLSWRGASLGWLLGAVGLLIPLLFHRDQLTQSVILLLIAATAGLALAVDGYRSTGRDETHPRKTPQGPLRPGEWTFLTACKGITIATYALAVLHKLNREFFDPDYSCAVYGVEKLFGYWNIPLEVAPEWLVVGAPWLVLGAEGGIALLHALGLRRPAWQLAVAFHIPLTVTMAPAFVFVMFVGHAAFFRPEDLRRLWSAFRRYWLPLLVAATALTATSLVAHQNLPEWTMIPREGLLWGLFVLLLVAFPPWRASTWSRRSNERDDRAPRSARLAAGAVIALFVLNGLTPYLGVQYQHAGAMVSNLRIDKGCWNSLVFPESVRLTDDYIRIDEAYFGEPGRSPYYEELLAEQLWDTPRIRQMRRNWCDEDSRPFYMRGTFREREFVIEDLCAGEPLPFEESGIFGVEIFEDYLRFQKNLERECPQACIH